MALNEELRDRQARLARNQTLFREVNERVSDVNAVWSERRAMDEWVCECANETCSERLKLTPAEYEEIRATPTHFLVVGLDTHVYLDVERVVERTNRYWVVEKLEHGAEVAERFDPRSRIAQGA